MSYLGVYENRYVPTMEEYQYRVAVKVYRDGTSEYFDIGLVDDYELAGAVYNVCALRLIGKRAVLNPIDMDDEVLYQKMKEYSKVNQYFAECIPIAASILEHFKEDIRFADHEH